VSDTGALVYVSGPQAANRTLVWVDRAGDEEPIPVPPRRAYTYAQLSPDNTHIALDVRQEERDVWIWDLARQTLQRLTFDPGPNRGPVWMPDGRRVLFSQMDDGFEEIFSQAADGAGMAEAVTKGIKRNIQPTAVLPDGTGVLFTQGGGTRDIGLATLGGPVAAGKWLLASPASETNATVSPDGRWIAYQSDESGREEIYVRPFPAVTTGRWQISTTGGTRPLWSRDGRELFYLAQGSTPGTIAAMAVAVSSGASLSVGPPAKLFEGAYLTPQHGRQVYDVSKDGKRFLMIKAAAADAAAPPPQIIVVQNWVEELRQLVPTK
jgi:Tol biopolymer transport system component